MLVTGLQHVSVGKMACSAEESSGLYVPVTPVLLMRAAGQQGWAPEVRRSKTKAAAASMEGRTPWHPAYRKAELLDSSSEVSQLGFLS